MCLNVENKQFNDESLIRFFRFNTSDNGTGTSSTYSKAVNSLVSFLRGHDAALLPDPATAVCDWIVHMHISGLSLNTALPYLNSVSALYKKAVGEGIAPPSDVFSVLKARLREGGDRLWSSWLSGSEFEKFRELMKPGRCLTDAHRLLLYSLVKGCLPVAEAAAARISDVADSDMETLGIDRSLFAGNRRYLFPLGQSSLTPARLAKKTADTVAALFAEKGVRHAVSADDTIRSYWAYAALRLGVAPHAVRSFLPAVPSGLPVLSLCGSAQLDETLHRQITDGVAGMFTENPMRWYVMRLRPRVSFDDLEKTFVRLAPELRRPELFYPCEEIRRRVGRKISAVRKPVIPDIVFFKCRETEVYPMFLKIGDLAWCYRINGRAGNAYAPVPKKAFETFQETICQFTPDYEVAPLGQLEPRVGDEIVVVGGLFQNQAGTLRKIEENGAESNKIYRIEIIPEGGGPVWNIGIDARIVRKKNAADD